MVMTPRQYQVADLLNRGRSIRAVAEELEVSKRRIYDLARRLQLPYNAPLKVGGRKWRQVQELYQSGYSPEELGKMFRLAPSRVNRIVREYGQRPRTLWHRR